MSNRWSLSNDDCYVSLSSLGDASVDHVITDPPYSSHVHGAVGGEMRNDGGRQRDVLGFDHITNQERCILAQQFARVCRRWTLVFCDDRGIGPWIDALEGSGLDIVRVGVWVKTDAMPQMSGDRPAAGCEWVVIAHPPGRKKWNGGGSRAVWTGLTEDPGSTRVHPTQKPLWLMEALIRLFTDRDELVLDAFAGSGSTGVACLRTGRRFEGFETDPKFHQIAQKRLENTHEQMELLARCSQ